jgi:hypothetical protein
VQRGRAELTVLIRLSPSMDCTEGEVLVCRGHGKAGGIGRLQRTKDSWTAPQKQVSVVVILAFLDKCFGVQRSLFALIS